MNYKLVKYYIGNLVKIEGMLMALPLLCSIIYRERAGIWYLISGVLIYLIGNLLCRNKTESQAFYTSESFVTVGLGWIVLSFFGAMPLFLSGDIKHFIDALFETMSGFTTTGATIIDNVEAMNRCNLLWRSFTHFIGGMGILVLVLAIIPAKSDNMLIMKAESPGPEVERIVPHVKDTAKMLYIIYVCLTIIAIVSYKISGMDLFDSICIGFGTAGTGGFSVLNSSCADYNEISKLLITIFMVIFGVNFNIYYLIILYKFKDVIKSEEFKAYIGILVLSIILITGNIIINTNLYTNIITAIRDVSFMVSSIMTTTGYAVVDINSWPMFSKVILLTLMAIGGCAGSTAGGFKVVRVIILIKEAFNELYLQIHPNAIRVLRVENKIITEKTRRTLNGFFIVYVLIFVISIALISIEGYDFETTVSSVAETFNNIGVGLSKVGPKGNFNIFSYPSKIIFIFLMLIGRLEIFPVVALFNFKTWNREK